MSGRKRCFLTAGTLLLGALLATVLAACGERGNQENGPLVPAHTAEMTATATKMASTPTLAPAATSTAEATPTIKSSPTAARTSTPEMITAVEITVAAANLRSGPGIEAEIMGFVDAEEFLEWVETSADGQWYRVLTEDGHKGWVGSSVARIVEREVYPGEEANQEPPKPEETPTEASE